MDEARRHRLDSTDKLIRFLDDLRRNWKPEHAADTSWVEEGVPLAPTVTAIARPNAQTLSPLVERQLVLDAVLQTDDDLEIEVNDLVRYVDVLKPDDVLSVRITKGPSDLANGLVSENTPLAQTLLGAIVSNEVPLHLPGGTRRLFRVVGITKPQPIATE